MQIVTNGKRKIKVPVGWALLVEDTRIKEDDMILKDQKWEYVSEYEISTVVRNRAAIRKITRSLKGEVIRNDRFIKELQNETE